MSSGQLCWGLKKKELLINIVNFSSSVFVCACVYMLDVTNA
jgi:hypothetical protein